MCECPTASSLARLDRLVERLDWLCLLGFFLPTRTNRDLDALMERAVDVQIGAHMSRHLCPVHGKLLRQLVAPVSP